MNQVEILFLVILTKYCITHKAILKNKKISGGMFNSYNSKQLLTCINTANLKKVRRREETRFCLDIC